MNYIPGSIKRLIDNCDLHEQWNLHIEPSCKFTMCPKCERWVPLPRLWKIPDDGNILPNHDQPA